MKQFSKQNRKYKKEREAAAPPLNPPVMDMKILFSQIMKIGKEDILFNIYT